MVVWFRVVGFIVVGLVLGACNGVVIYKNGVPAHEWNKLSLIQQRDVIKKNNEAERKRHVSLLRKSRNKGVSDQVNYTLLKDKKSEVLYVEVFGGKVRLNGKRREYKKVVFNIANGESREIIFDEKEIGSYRNRTINILVEYIDGYLIFDSRYEKYAYQIRRKGRWRKGSLYKNINLSDRSWSEARGLNIYIEIQL